MGTKIGFLLGVSAGVYLALKLKPEQAQKIRNIAAEIKYSTPIQAAGQKASDTVGQTLRNQGIAVTDHLAEQIKQKLFTPPQPKEDLSSEENTPPTT